MKKRSLTVKYLLKKAKVKKNSICDETTCIGYDVKLKKAVFIDPELLILNGKIGAFKKERENRQKNNKKIAV